jgi:hypothetical protein
MASSVAASRLLPVARLVTELSVEASIAARKSAKMTSDVRNERPRFFICFEKKGLRLTPVGGRDTPTFGEIQ